MNIKEIEKILNLNGPRLAYQALDGMNWKQITFNDIKTNLNYIHSYLINNNMINKKVLSLSCNCVDSYILESSLLNLGCTMSFADKKTLLDINFDLDFDVIIINNLNNINENNILKNVAQNKHIISIEKIKKFKESNMSVISLQGIYKSALLSRNNKKEYEHELNINNVNEIFFIKSNEIKSCKLNDLSMFIDKNQNLFSSFNVNDFSTYLYLKKDLFSKSINFLMLKFKNKFISNNSLNELMENINEIMPSNLIIDNDNLKEIIKLCYINKNKFSELTGSKVKTILTYNLSNEINLEKLEEENIKLINIKN